MKRTLCLLLALALPLSGCSRRVELTFMAVCLGVDVGENGVVLTVKCPGYSGDGQPEQKGYAVLSAAGEDWPRAVAALYAAAPVSPQFSQLREIFISEDSFPRMPARRVLELIDQLPGLRVHALVTVCPGTARAMVEKLTPQIGKRLSKYLDIALAHWEEQGEIPATSLSCALRDADGGWRDPVLAYTDGESYAGAYALGSLSPLRLTARETQLYRLIRGESQSFLLDRGGSGCGAASRGAARRRIDGDTLILTLPVYITYSLYDEPPGGEAEAALREEAQALLTRMQAAGCDAFGFGCQAVRAFSTLPEWQNSGWRERYRGMKIRVETDCRYRQQPIF